MLIKALCDYADKLEESGTKLNTGWTDVRINYRIFLNEDGSISNIVNVEVPTGKKGKPAARQIKLPDRTNEAGENPTTICSYIIEHRPIYIFGLENSKGFLVSTNKSKKAHDAFIERNLRFFDGLDSEICRAYINFINKWNPEDEINNSILEVIKNFNGGCGWSLSGARDYLEQDEQFIKKYEDYLNGQTYTQITSNCGVLGEKLPIARTHNVVKLPIGAKKDHRLVCMNNSAFESYGKTQSNNSNVSVKAMKRYTSALNELLKSEKHNTIIDDIVIIYFAIKRNDIAECESISKMLGNVDEQADTDINIVLDGIKKGKIDYSRFGVDENVDFYIIGLTSSYPRVSQKFIYKDRFGHIIENLLIHQKDLMINPDSDRQIYFSSIARELVSPKSTNEKVPPPLMSGIMMSAFKGTNYPCSLLASVIRRVKTDQDEEKNHFIKLNDTRAGIIKACINRKLRNSGQKEEIIMAWDENNLNPSYLCGGLFAVYEKIQKESAGGDLNRTIKDSYFASACSRPSVIMPKLAKLSQNHLRKLEDGSRKRYNNLIIELMNGFNSDFPKTQDLDSQGRFIIGYYQMQKKLYTPKSENK